MNARAAFGRWSVFGVLAGVGYVLAYTNEFTPFYYYPIGGELRLFPYQPELGPGITYYAWKCVGLLVGLPALLLPARWAERVPVNGLAVGVLLLAGVVGMHESHWFFK